MPSTGVTIRWGRTMATCPTSSSNSGTIGRATLQVVGSRLTGEGGLLDADGAAFVIHAGPDDYKTDPSGNSGGRVACGVIQLGAAN